MRGRRRGGSNGRTTLAPSHISPRPPPPLHSTRDKAELTQEAARSYNITKRKCQYKADTKGPSFFQFSLSSGNMAGYKVWGQTRMVSKLTVTLALMCVTLATAAASSDSSSAPSGPLRHLLKGVYVQYAHGRRSERDMPECSSMAEACNLAHQRYWFTPITERLCRCRDRSECPLHFTDLHDPLSQHVSNRAQLKFCGPVMQSLPLCRDGEKALRMQYIERKSQVPYESSTAPEATDTHTTLLCRCPWPQVWSLANTTTSDPSTNENVSVYKCQKLPQCRSGDQCGYIRGDTFETYYTCSCPEHHLCVFMGPQKPTVTSQLHFHGNAYTGHCTPR